MRHFSMKVSTTTSQASKASAVGPVQRQVLTVAGCFAMLWKLSTWTVAHRFNTCVRPSPPTSKLLETSARPVTHLPAESFSAIPAGSSRAGLRKGGGKGSHNLQ